jgi:hypothetical protein
VPQHISNSFEFGLHPARLRSSKLKLTAYLISTYVGLCILFAIGTVPTAFKKRSKNRGSSVENDTEVSPLLGLRNRGLDDEARNCLT